MAEANKPPSRAVRSDGLWSVLLTHAGPRGGSPKGSALGENLVEVLMQISIVRRVWLCAGLFGIAAGLAPMTGCQQQGVEQGADLGPHGIRGVVREDEVANARRAVAERLIELHAFAALPDEHQRIIAAAGSAPKGDDLATMPSMARPWERLAPLGDEEYALVSKFASRELWDRMMPVHQHALVDLLVRRAAGADVPALCFAPGTDPELVDAFNTVVFGRFGVRFQPANRWSTTATNGGGLTQGQTTTLTYSFPPDGTTSTTLTNGVTQPSDLFAFLNGIYGTTAAWQAVYAQVFTRWSQLCGVDYVFEPNDDGVPISSQPGVLGVRGDLRLTGTALDGPSNVLAFNSFPNNGDMVIDTADTFYTSTASNSLRLRNVLAHEHGHGLGMAHVCPTNQTKLMEPFISLAYDGPQTDDRLLAQRFYGDQNEPNDTPATATTLTAPTTLNTTITGVSCDDRLDNDVYRIPVSAPGLLTVTVRPVGGNYLNGAQNGDGSCSAGVLFNAAAVNDLGITFLDSNGVTILGTTNTAGVGVSETAAIIVDSARDIFVRIQPGPVPNIQAYELDYRVQSPPILVLSLADAVPTQLNPTQPTALRVRVQTLGETVAVGSVKLRYRFDTLLSFAEAPLTFLGGEIYEARIPPAPCGSTPQFYVQLIGQTLGLRTFPAAAPGSNGSAALTAPAESTSVVFDDSFETDLGWTVGFAGDTAISGIWVRADPNGTIAQPEDDQSAIGTQCYFTGQAAVGAQAGTADVDGGKTTLVSPTINLLNVPAPVLSYYRWYSNSGGATPGTDVFTVDVSADNGASWQNLQTIGPATNNTGGWVFSQLNLASVITPSATVRLRFVADDASDGSLVEAAIDDVQIVSTSCNDRCRGDINGDNRHSVQDLFDFLAAYFASAPAGEFNFDGLWTVQDIFDFLAAWFAPCP